MFEPRPNDASTVGTALLAWAYRRSRAVHPQRTFDGLAQAAVLFVRLLQQRETLRDWPRAGNPALQERLAWRPSLVSVVQRPYIHTGWSASRRLQAIDEHYRLLTGPARALRLEPEAVVRLATVDSRGSRIDIVLDSPDWFIHEGELSLNLFLDGQRIYSIAFSFGFDGAEPVAYVGALQGLGSDCALGIYRTLTHALHGLRPRDLLIAAFRVVCREVGLARWLAMGDERRVSRSAYFRKPIPVHSSYDAAWSEHGGRPRPDGFHDMLVRVARRSHDEIPARKRSAYRQRYDMLDRLDADLTLALRRHGEPDDTGPPRWPPGGRPARAPVERACR